MNKQLLKTSSADVLSSRKKLRKTLGVASTPPRLLIFHCNNFLRREQESHLYFVMAGLTRVQKLH